MVRGIFVTAVCLAFSAIGCGSDDGGSEPSSGGSGGAGASGATGGSSGTGGGTANCDDAFVVLPSPYVANTALDEWGGFAVDDRGAVFTAAPDSSLMEDTTDLPYLIMASDPAGNLTTLYSGDGSSLYGKLILHGDNVYMLEGPIFPTIVRMDRSGGAPVEVVGDTVFEGPILGGDSIYYATGGSDVAIHRLDPETGASTLVIARDSNEIAALDLDGDTLYWIESDGPVEDTDYRLFSMPAAGGTPEMLQSLPRAELALGSFRVVDRVLFGSEITADLDLVVTRTPIGEATEIVEDLGGMPMVIGGGFAYYGSGGGGVVKAPLSFESKTTIAGSEGRSIFSLALGPDDLWYSEWSCVFRTAK